MSGLFLNQNEIDRLRLWWSEIKKIEEEIGYTFERCIQCKGTGLDGWNKTFEDGYGTNYSWDGTYCSYCRGKKISNFRLGYLYYNCPKCNGLGKIKNEECDYCEGKCFVDWIKFLRYVK